jgi:hypothetical protein
MTFKLHRKINGLYYWLAEGSDKLVEHEFIQFQGKIIGMEEQFVVFDVGTWLSFKHYSQYKQQQTTKQIHVEINIIAFPTPDDVLAKWSSQEMVLNSLTIYPKTMDALLDDAEQARAKAVQYDEWLKQNKGKPNARSTSQGQ